MWELLLKYFIKILLLIPKWIWLPFKVDTLSTDIKGLQAAHKEIREALIAAGLLKPFTQSKSPKQITARGYALLKANNSGEFLSSNCELLNKDQKNVLQAKKDFEIFIECFRWVKDKGKKKVLEIMYNSNLGEEQCSELLALYLLEKIKDREPKIKTGPIKSIED